MSERDAELKVFAFAEIQRAPSIPYQVREELVHVLEIFFAARPPLLDCDKLAKLLQTGSSEDRLRLDLVTAVVPEANPQISSMFLDFLSQEGELQDGVLKARALVTNVVTGEQAQFRDPNFIRKRANQLAQCFIENHSIVIDALLNTIRTCIGSQATPESRSVQYRSPDADGNKLIWTDTMRALADWILQAWHEGKLKATSDRNALDQAAVHFVVQEKSGKLRELTGKSLQQNLSNRRNEGK
jgi:hypothetical protein